MVGCVVTAVGLINVEVAYALPDEQKILTLQLPQGATVQEAIEQSQVLERATESEQADMAVGIFGKVVPMSRVLREGERVEIYRTLMADPKQARRMRVAQARKAAVPRAE